MLGENFVWPCEEGREYSVVVIHGGYSQVLKGEMLALQELGAVSELTILQGMSWDTGSALQERQSPLDHGAGPGRRRAPHGQDQ